MQFSEIFNFLETIHFVQKQPQQSISWKSSEEKNSRAVGVNSLVSNSSDIPLFTNPAVRQVLAGGERMFPNVVK